MSAEEREKKYVLAIDHGTSAMKVTLANMCGDLLGLECNDTPVYLFPGGGAEQNPDEWWSAFVNATKRLIDQNIVPVEDIVAVCCSSQWAGTVPVDADGNHLMNAIIWMDSRGKKYIMKILKGLINIQGYGILNLLRWIRKTAGIPQAKDPGAHMLYLKNEHPEIYEQTYKFLEPKDYMNLRLTGECAASVDSLGLHWMTDIRDLLHVKYDYGLIHKLGLDHHKLPPIMHSVEVLETLSPTVADELGLSKETKVVMGAADIPAAIIGSGAVKDYEGHIYVGTSSWVITHVPFKKTDVFHNMATVASAIPGRYFVVNEQEIAGGCLTYLRDNVLYPEGDTRCGDSTVYQEFDRIAETASPGANGLIFTPWLYGERTPVENHTVRGGLLNISLPIKREDIIRAVFEGVTFNSRWLFELVEKFIKREMNPVNMIGGGAQSDIWCQIYADVLNRTVRQVKDPIMANARGAAFLASVGLGYCTFDEIPSLIKYNNTFHPNPEHRALYDKIFKEFLEIYKKNKKMYARLNEHL